MPTPGLHPALDNNLPPIEDVDLQGFCKKYYELARLFQDSRSWEFGPHTELALTGTYENQALQKRRLRLVRGAEVVDPDDIEQTSDVDSSIGWLFQGDPFPLLPGNSIFLYVLNNPEYSLSRSLHIPPYCFRGEDGEETGQIAHYHDIPNMYIGHIGGANVPQILIRAFFPEQIRGKQAYQSKCMPTHIKTFYNEGLYPAVLEVLPREVHQNWPTCYDDDEWRSRKESGRLSHASHAVKDVFVDPLLEALYEKIASNPALKFAKNMFLQFQIQNTKDATRHCAGVPSQAFNPGVGFQPQENEEDSESGPDDSLDEDHLQVWQDNSPEMQEFIRVRGDAMSAAVRPLDVLKFQPGNWYFDIASTFRLSGPYSLMPRSDRQAELLSMVTGMTVARTARLIGKGETGGFFYDEWAQTGIFGGSRITLRNNKGPWSTEYVQIYPTDKTLTALKDKDLFAKRVQPQAVCRDFPKVDDKYFTPLLDVLHNAASQARPVEVRIESRVPFAYAFDVHRQFPSEQIAEWMSKVKSENIWQWKVLRVESASAVLQRYWDKANSIPREKVLGPGTLIAGLCWISNAALNRPQSGDDFKTLQKKITVHQQQGDRSIPSNELNALFFHTLKMKPYPRVSHHRMLDMTTLASIMGIGGEMAHGAVHRLISYRGNHPRTHGGPGPNREQRSSDIDAPNPPENDEDLQYLTVSRAPRMRTVLENNDEQVLEDNEIVQIPESINEVQYDSEDQDGLEEGVANQTMLQNIFRVFTVELVKKVPSVRAGPSWRKMHETEVSGLGWADLKNSETINRIFIGWRQEMNGTSWQDAVNRLFPTLKEYEDKTSGNGKYLQGIAQCSWFQDWIQLLAETADEKNQKALVSFARNKLSRQAGWLPKTASDRMWMDKGGQRASEFGRRVNNKNPPIILLNPARGLDVTIPGGKAADHGVESL